MIRVENLRKSFGAQTAVADASFIVPPAAMTIVAGADGAGKSTLFKMLVGLVRRDGGEIYLAGKPLGRHFERLTSITGYMPERFSLYPDLTVEENIDFFAAVHGVASQRLAELKQRLLEKTGMLAFRARRARDLSGGMKQKLALSTILLASPQLIILDEPTTGVDPLSRLEFFAILHELKAEGRTILLATPYLDEAEKGDRVVFLKGGRVLLQESIARLKATFPARLFRVRPRGNPFAVLEELRRDPELARNVYLRGGWLKVMQAGDNDWLARIPAEETVEEQPTLEDIYLYHERHAG